MPVIFFFISAFRYIIYYLPLRVVDYCISEDHEMYDKSNPLDISDADVLGSGAALCLDIDIPSSGRSIQ